MGIETILIVIGLLVVIAATPVALRVKRNAGDTQAPKTTVPSSVKPHD